MAWCTECGNLAYTNGWHKPFCPCYENQRRIYIGQRIDRLNDELSRARIGRAMLESAVNRLRDVNTDLLAACKVAYETLGQEYGHAYAGPEAWDMMQGIKAAIDKARSDD